VAHGERAPGAVRDAALEAMAPFDVEPEYLALVHPDTLAPLDAVEGDVLVAVAAHVGPTRLIDNTLIHTNGRPR
jgi:pantoate--beta-alanine ligase